MSKGIFTKQIVAVVTSLGLLTFSGATAMAATNSAPAPASPVAMSQAPTLSYGSSGAAVSRLQQQLKTLGYYHYSSITGYYGDYTSAAVGDFQWAYGLTVDSIAGSGTQQAVTHAIEMLNVVQDAYNYTRIPYVWGGATPNPGFDCSGFVYYLYHTHGLALPRLRSQDYFTMGRWIPKEKLQIGDLVFFNTDGDTASHVGFYAGGGQFISATSTLGVWTYTLDNPYWAPRYNGARRI